VIVVAAVAGWISGGLPAPPALFAALAGLGLSVTGGRALVTVRRAQRRERRAARQRERTEEAGRRAERAAWQAGQAARTAHYARAYRDWQQRSAASWRQPHWYPATVPAHVSRVDLAGGTMAGWSALLTTLAAFRLAAGGQVTVLDLTEGGVASDLLAVAHGLSIDPLVWVLPADLPTLDLGLRFSPDALAEVLALTAAAAGTGSGPPAGTADAAGDASLLLRVFQALGPGVSVAQLIAGLRALAHIGDPRRHLSAGELPPQQLTNLSAAFGRGADRLVADRAWSLEATLRVLGPLGTAAGQTPRSRLRLAWLDRRASATGNRVLGCYLAVALTEVLRQAPRGTPWHQTICLLGAERLPGDLLDRLCEAAEAARAGLLLGYRSIPPAVAERLGRGDATVAFMRLGNAADARAAAEQIGSGYRFVVSQLTDTVGASVTDTGGASYTSTVGFADSVGDTTSATWTAGSSRGRSRTATFAPFGPAGSASRDASRSAAVSDSRAVTASISGSTSWGLTTSRAVGTSSSLAGTLQRSRELVIEQHELQHLPPTAVVICGRNSRGRQVLLADANPAIMTLPTATLAGRPGLGSAAGDDAPDP
jgi:hypothetical protein